MDSYRLSRTKRNGEYHIVFLPNTADMQISGVSTATEISGAEVTMWVQSGETKSREYVRNQLQEAIAADQISIKEFTDRFTGETVNRGK